MEVARGDYSAFELDGVETLGYRSSFLGHHRFRKVFVGKTSHQFCRLRARYGWNIVSILWRSPSTMTPVELYCFTENPCWISKLEFRVVGLGMLALEIHSRLGHSFPHRAAPTRD